MFQPEVKWKFVERYCNPKNGWEVFVDIDASELGKTGGPRTTDRAIQRQRDMQASGLVALNGLRSLRVQVGGSRDSWISSFRNKYPEKALPEVSGDRDIVAINPDEKKLLIAEAEGDSAGQPEQKLYKAIGQLVMGIWETSCKGYRVHFILVVHGEEMKAHAQRAKVLQELRVSALHISESKEYDEWLFGLPLE